MNLSGILQLFDNTPAYAQTMEDVAQIGEGLHPLGLPSSGQSAVLAKQYLDNPKPTILIVGRVDLVPIWQQTLQAWLPDEIPVLRYFEPTPLPYEHGPWGEIGRLSRLRVLNALVAGQDPRFPALEKPPIIITSARAFLQKTLPKRTYLKETRGLRVGEIIDRDAVAARWQGIGYEIVPVVETQGQYSKRGGILDVFPPSEPYGIRVELFGDEIETIRYFDPATQRSTEIKDNQLEKIIVPPAREALPSEIVGVGHALQMEMGEKEEDLPSWEDDINDLMSGMPSANMEYYLPMLYSRSEGLLSYISKETQIVVTEWAELGTAVSDLHTQAHQLSREQLTLPPGLPHPLVVWDDFAANLAERGTLVLGYISDDQRDPDEPPTLLADSFQNGPRFGGQLKPFITQLKQATRDEECTIVVSRQASRLAELWGKELKNNSAITQTAYTPRVLDSIEHVPSRQKVTFVNGSLAEGFTLENYIDNDIVLNLLTDAEIFGWNRPQPRRRRKARAFAPETHFSDLKAGDNIVHLEYGIGRFEGLVVRQMAGNDREYLHITYGKTDKLYVPVHHADRISRWVGPDEHVPKLNRIGDKRWTAARTKAQKAVAEMAEELLDLYSQRETVVGFQFSEDSEWQADLEASFPYQETEDQLSAIEDVKQDMERPIPMDRLICGDVGFGKTEVALRAAFKAVNDGKQVAILVPTTVLAQQHYNNFKERLKPWPIKVDMLSRFRTQSQQEATVKGLREGEVDIIIGTHRLVSDDVVFKDLGLLIIDEEQRFGIGHKEKLKQLRIEVDVLTMTATPIPRTLYMGLTGARDISTIDTAPAERLPVQTYVGEFEESMLRRAILRELDRGGQVFVVHNRVQTIEIIKKQIEALVPEASVVIGHGQMGERQLEKIMVDFAAGEIDILLSTTIIESGIDIPNANTLIVDKAEMFGLSQLYQLRGRVGRSVNRAYAYFFHSPWRTLTGVAQQRLETIDENQQLGAGYQIAMRDLEIRGAGDLLGANQSGHIATVGFDLYTRLLATAVKQRKQKLEQAEPGETIPQYEIPNATLIDLPIATFVPPDYVPDAALRLRLYRRMALLDELDAIEEMSAELADRFGPIPEPVHNLLFQLRVKVLAEGGGISAVLAERQQIQIRMELDGLSRFRIQRFLGEDARVSRRAIFLPKGDDDQWRVSLVQLLERIGGMDTSKFKETGS